MKKYVKADCEVVSFLSDDVIRTSNDVEYPSKWINEGGENGEN